MVHHSNYCIVILLILVIEEYKFCPEMSLFCSSEHLVKQKYHFDSLTASHLHLQCSYPTAYLWNINSRPEELQMFPHFLRLEFGV